MVDVRVICAIGKQGQLGLNGRLPWEGNPGTEYKTDVQRFFALIRGHVVIAGPRTITSFPDWARSDRTLVEIHAADELDAILKRYCDRVVYVGGGPPVWTFAYGVRPSLPPPALPSAGHSTKCRSPHQSYPPP